MRGLRPGRFLRGLPEERLGVLAEQLVELEAAVRLEAQERAIDERGQGGERGAGDRPGRVAPESAPEDGHPAQGRPLGAVQPGPGLIEDRLHAAVALGEVAQAGGEDVEAQRQVGGDLGTGEGADPGGGQLEGQGQPLGEAADAADRFRFAVEREIPAHAAGALGEELHGAERLVREGRAVRRAGQPRHREAPLLLQGERLPRRDQQLHAGRGREHGGEHPGALEQVLEVVQDEQGATSGEGVAQPGEGIAGPRQGQPQGVRDRRGDQLGRGQRLEGHEVHAVDERAGLRHPGRGAQGEPGLARAARAHQGEQPASRRAQQPGNLDEIVLAAEEGGRERGQRHASSVPGRTAALKGAAPGRAGARRGRGPRSRFPARSVLEAHPTRDRTSA